MNRSISSRIATGDSEIRRVAGRLIQAFLGSRRHEAALEVRLLTNDCVPDQSDEVAAVLARLRRCERIRLDSLVRDTAEALYRREMARGGSNVDLGFFGPRVFEPMVRSAIDAGRGRLWEIFAPAHQPDVS
jgi:hypothetical protein